MGGNHRSPDVFALGTRPTEVDRGDAAIHKILQRRPITESKLTDLALAGWQNLALEPRSSV